MRRSKCFAITITIIIIVTWKFFQPFVYLNYFEDPEDYLDIHYKTSQNAVAPLRVVHLDLKGAPPKITYLKELLPFIVASGGNALLIEYEDMFPYEGLLENVSARTAYSQGQITEFISLCDYYGIEVIPLIQTFGHLEYLLKLEEFKHLREVPFSPQEICPSNFETIIILEEMITQVMKLHRKSKRIHIGCDEIYNLNVCSKCIKLSMDSRDVFLQHVKTVASFITAKFPGVMPLIWDDMLRTWPSSFINESNLNKYVQPVIWVYGTDIRRLIPLSYWYWYFKHFENIWIAGAFKGATNEIAMIPNISLHVENQKSWLRFISQYSQTQTKIMGYVLTGWSRYDHYAALCELLPVAIPSLILNLILISSVFVRQKNTLSSYNEILKCKPNVSMSDVLQLTNTYTCIFPGQELIPLTLMLIDFQYKINFMYEQLYESNPWLTEYHLKQRSTNFFKVRRRFDENKFPETYQIFVKFSDNLKFNLRKYYEEHTVKEWLLEHVELYLNKLHILDVSLKKLRTYS